MKKTRHFCLEREAGLAQLVILLKKLFLDLMRPIFIAPGFEYVCIMFLCVFVGVFFCMHECDSGCVFCVLFGIGSGDEESSREEYEVGEYVLEDLELGSAKETG